MTDKSREEFETWAIERKFAYRNEHGFWAYPAFDTAMMYQAWEHQQSRIDELESRLKISETQARGHHNALRIVRLALGMPQDSLDGADLLKRIDRINTLERTFAAMTAWLEQNQPDVFQRGLWDAISAQKEGEKT